MEGLVETSDGVRRFRVISCRDAALALSKCAGWYSVKSVTPVFKRPLPNPPRGGGSGWRGGLSRNKRNERNRLAR